MDTQGKPASSAFGRSARSTIGWAEHLAAALGLTWVFLLAMRRRRPPPAPPGDPPQDPVAPTPETVARIGDARLLRGDWGLYDRIPAHERFERERSPVREWLKRRALGRDRVPIPSYIGVIEAPPPQGAPPKTGVCGSGGGIRSA